MDELVHHCLRELSFDGDLGCDVSRLKDFIVSFYEHTSNTPQHQNVDDAFCAFIWSLIVQQPTVRIGTVPVGSSGSEVYLAPQVSAKRKALAKGEDHDHKTAPVLDLIPDDNTRPLDELRMEYGEQLRIAVDPQTSFVAITGSHTRPAKLSPMVYTALQIITRGRENGISVVDLGKKSKYDQKTCHYLINQLIALDLVVKVRRGGVGTHFCIHKYFFERSELWKQIRGEEAQAQAEDAGASVGTRPPEQSIADQVDASEGSQQQSASGIHFDPIDARHLSSLPLVRSRVVKLLKASKNHIHASQNMLLTIGFANPTKTDRRFFTSRMRELIQQGIIEKVVAPSKRDNSYIKCFQLVSPESKGTLPEAVQVDGDEGDFEVEEPSDEQSGVKANLTIHKQISNLLEDAGTRGMTLSELSAGLGNFDRRIIELLLSRAADKLQPPPHLADLGTAALMETHRRERRHRYFTVAAFRALVEQEGLDDKAAGCSDVDFGKVGGFLDVQADGWRGAFWTEEDELLTFENEYREVRDRNSKGKAKEKRPKGRPRKVVVQDVRAQDEADVDNRAIVNRGGKRKRSAKEEYEHGDTDALPTSKKRKGLTVSASVDQLDNDAPVLPSVVPRKRGRPRKVRFTEPGDPQSIYAQDVVELPPVPTKRGRLLKHKSGKEITKSAEEPVTTQAMEAVESNILTTSAPEQEGESSVQNSDTPLMVSDTGLVPTKPDQMQDQSSLIIGSTSAGVELPDKLPTILASVERKGIQPRRSSRIAKPLDRRVDVTSPSMRNPAKDQVSAHEESCAPWEDVSVVMNSGDSENCQASTSARTPRLPLEQEPQALSGLRLDSLIPIDPALMPNEDMQISTTGQDTNLNGKRSLSTTAASSARPTKRRQTAGDQGSHAKVNMSHLRRENELIRVIQNLGGIANTHTKELFDAHMALIESMVQAGEPTSGPVGVRLDKRTADTTFTKMESHGRVKMLKTSVITPTGISRPACIVYLPDIEQERVNAFLRDLSQMVVISQPTIVKKIEEPLDHSAESATPRVALPLQLLQMENPGLHDRTKKIDSAKQLFKYDDMTIRDVLLTERTTPSQYYGYKVGKAVRSRDLHLCTLSRFESAVVTPGLVSNTKRIVHLSYFYQDLPIAEYCAYVPSLVFDENLADVMGTEEGRNTSVRCLPQNMLTSLQIGRSRAKSRILHLLQFLEFLGLVVPLQPSVSDTPWISCEPNEGHPSAYKLALSEGWSVSTPQIAPVYWHFTANAPIHLWVLSEGPPILWKQSSILNHADAVIFWQDLQSACTNRTSAQSLSADLASIGTDVDVKNKTLVRSLRRSSSWHLDYVLTWHQSYFMKQFVDLSTGHTPLQDPSGGQQLLDRISWVTSAPSDVVHSFFMRAHAKAVCDLERTREKAKHRDANKKAEKAAKAKALLAKKAAEAHAQRERDWDEIVARVYPEPLKGTIAARINRVRLRFLQSSSGKDKQKWEDEIAQAVREVNMTSKGLGKRAAAGGLAPIAPPPPVVTNYPEKSIKDLIAAQGPARVVPPPRPKGKRRKAQSTELTEETAEDPAIKIRRHRFLWNRDFDELARDALAIIRSRCRTQSRIDLSPFEQVFPAVPRNSVRQRLAHLREIPGTEAYLKRLEDQWHQLWLEHMGTNLLPDDDPESTSNFNLSAHIDFLRRHVDKNALRVGFTPVKEASALQLPTSVDELLQDCDVIESVPTVPPWDFMWNTTVEEGREKNSLRQSFTVNTSDLAPPMDISLDTICLAESALKMTFGTPNESYDPMEASRLLRSIGEEAISTATTNLLGRGVLSKRNRDPKKITPGRSLKIAEMNQNALGGSITSETFQDASTLEDISAEQESTWRDWPLLSSDGDLAALIQMVSDNNVEFKIDTTQPQAARNLLDWNSKKADDDHIETAILVRFRDLANSRQSPSTASSPVTLPVMLDNDGTGSGHGKTAGGGDACCFQSGSAELSDCVACLDIVWRTFAPTVSVEERKVSERILIAVRDAGYKGLDRDQLLADLASPQERVMHLVREMVDKMPPLLLWTGYKSPVLVSPEYLQSWSVEISSDPLIRRFPRRWLDISGLKIGDIWQASLRAVLGIVLFRPGVPQSELYWRLRSVYDRQEVNDLLKCLRVNGYLDTRNEGWEDSTCWFIGRDRHWYQI